MKKVLMDNKTNTGFTLLEVMLALAIISLSFFTIIHSFYLIDKSNISSSNYTQAMLLSQYLAHEFKHQENSFVKSKGSFAGPFKNFSWHIKKINSSLDNYEKIDIGIFWTNRGEGKSAHFTQSLRTINYEN